MAFARLSFIGVLLLVGLLYLPVYDFQYVWDDFALFLDSSALRGGERVWGAISQPILPGTTYFRPLVLLSFVLEFKWLGLDPKFAHIINLSLHLLNVFLVGVLANALKRDGSAFGAWRSAIAMLIYGLHPALIEPVAWISGRFDLLVTSFVLVGIYAGLKGSRAGLFFSMLFFFLAALSKEMAATFPLLFILFVWASELPRERDFYVLKAFLVGRTIQVLLGVIVAGVGYLYLRYLAVPNIYHQDLRVAGSVDLLAHAALVGHTILFYSRMVLWPFSDLNPMHPFDAAAMSTGQIMSGLLVLTVWGAGCITAIWIRGRCLLLFLAGWVALLPVMNLVPLTIGGNIGHERFLALPMVFFSLCVSQIYIKKLNLSAAMQRVYPWCLAVLVTGWVGIACLNLRVTLPLWTNELTLWTWAYKKHPNFPFVQFSLMAAALRQGQFDIAGKVLTEVEEKGQFLPKMNAIKALYLQRKGHHEEALVILEDVLSHVYQPHLEVLNNGFDLADAQLARKSFGDSWFLRFVYGALAESNLSLRNYDEVLRVTKVANFYQVDYAPPYLLASLAMYGKGDKEGGDRLFGIALGYYFEQGRQEAEKLRSSFLSQICSAPDRLDSVCGEISGH